MATELLWSGMHGHHDLAVTIYGTCYAFLSLSDPHLLVIQEGWSPAQWGCWVL